MPIGLVEIEGCCVHYYNTKFLQIYIRCSIVASIPACHAGDRGSIPRDGVLVRNMMKRELLLYLPTCMLQL